ncbi:MAG: asparagine synthetase [Thermoprotei archaeon]|nr:asparagine synthetase [Thermoproteales archaeon]RLE97906.1 MAG: asparagine synthetase [Thermoprotei archaeon]
MKAKLVKLPKPLEELSGEELERKRAIARVMTLTLEYLTSSLIREGYEWLLPVILSRVTDPLWPDPGASIEKRLEVEIYGVRVRATLSMIIHKMVACSLAYPKLFVLSPNIRVERRDRAWTGLHAYEFTQLDFEARGASSRDIMGLVEKLLRGLVEHLKKSAREELSILGRYGVLRVPDAPFRVYDREDLEAKYGGKWEVELARDIREPVWVVNIPRQFYDYEDFETGRWDNYDLYLPGLGEVLSGARREWEYEKLVKKMERDGVRKENYALLLRLAREGRLKPTAGAGIGVERLVAWVVGAEHVCEVQPFPRIPGVVYEL